MGLWTEHEGVPWWGIWIANWWWTGPLVSSAAAWAEALDAQSLLGFCLSIHHFESTHRFDLPPYPFPVDRSVDQPVRWPPSLRLRMVSYESSAFGIRSVLFRVWVRWLGFIIFIAVSVLASSVSTSSAAAVLLVFLLLYFSVCVNRESSVYAVAFVDCVRGFVFSWV